MGNCMKNALEHRLSKGAHSITNNTNDWEKHIMQKQSGFGTCIPITYFLSQ